MPPRKIGTGFSRALIHWYRRNARPLPWRKNRNPYPIWVSEIMLQQTRVETVIPYYRRFLRRFPSVAALGRAGLQPVLKEWEGLGYYARARNLHAAAREVVAEHGGRLPRAAADWARLPGVGRYAAAAIAAFAFDEPTVALDANVRRILVRVLAVRRDPLLPAVEKDLAAGFAQTRGKACPGEFLQSMMELGQRICLPRNPRCGDCPVAAHCLAKGKDLQNALPLRPKTKTIPHADVTAAVIERRGQYLLAQRPTGKLLAGMWEFPGGKREPGETLPACLRRELREELGIDVRVGRRICAVEHAFTHLRITLHAYRCILASGTPKSIDVAACRWVAAADLGTYPMGKADRTVAGFLRP
jgi:A/G-specific adenine glycosylase